MHGQQPHSARCASAAAAPPHSLHAKSDAVGVTTHSPPPPSTSHRRAGHRASPHLPTVLHMRLHAKPACSGCDIARRESLCTRGPWDAGKARPGTPSKGPAPCTPTRSLVPDAHARPCKHGKHACLHGGLPTPAPCAWHTLATPHTVSIGHGAFGAQSCHTNTHTHTHRRLPGRMYARTQGNDAGATRTPRRQRAPLRSTPPGVAPPARTRPLPPSAGRPPARPSPSCCCRCCCFIGRGRRG